MPAELSMGQQNSELLSGRRRSQRRTCNLLVNLITSRAETSARLRDLSAEGVGFTADPLLDLRPAERLVMSHRDLGEIRLILRWAAPPRYGAEIEPRTQNLAPLIAFYDRLPPAADQAQ